MKIFSSEDIRFIENCAVETSTSFEQLMDKAGKSVVAFLKKTRKLKNEKIVVLCGKGNNAGDGFICANGLYELGAKVAVVLVDGLAKTEIAQNAFYAMDKNIPVHNWEDNKFAIETELEKAHVIIDAIFGIGFRGMVDDNIARLMNWVNKCMQAYKLAIDIPSGCDCNTGKISNACIKADTTVTFTGLKPAHVLSPSNKMCGKNVIVQVGIEKKIIDSIIPNFILTKEEDIISNFSIREANSHKGTFGRLLMICGSYGMLGAAIMAGKAALRSGVGLLNMVVDKNCYPIIAAALPEAIFTVMDFSTEEQTKKSTEALFVAINKATACVIGSGLGEDSQKYVPTVVKFSPSPVVLDADALNYISKNLDLLSMKNSPLVITPHIGEMARLTGRSNVQIELDKLGTAKRFAKEYDVITVLKGAGTIVASPNGQTSINTTGNSGMATAGSGDVLAGVIGALIAQGIDARESAVSGVFIHGKAGDISARQFSHISMIAGDIIDNLPQVFKDIYEQL